MLILIVSPLSVSTSFTSTVIRVRVEPVMLTLSGLATGIVFGNVVTMVVQDPDPTEFDTSSEYGVSIVGDIALEPMIGAGVFHGDSIDVSALDPVHARYVEVQTLILELVDPIVQLGSDLVSMLALQLVVPLILVAESI